MVLAPSPGLGASSPLHLCPVKLAPENQMPEGEALLNSTHGQLPDPCFCSSWVPAPKALCLWRLRYRERQAANHHPHQWKMVFYYFLVFHVPKRELPRKSALDHDPQPLSKLFPLPGAPFLQEPPTASLLPPKPQLRCQPLSGCSAGKPVRSPTCPPPPSRHPSHSHPRVAPVCALYDLLPEDGDHVLLPRWCAACIQHRVGRQRLFAKHSGREQSRADMSQAGTRQGVELGWWGVDWPAPQ